MAAQTNYEDNLYFLNLHLKTLRNGIGLDIDPEFFLQKLVNDILFHDSVLNKLLAALTKNTNLIRRKELLRLVMLAHTDFMHFIDDIATIDSGMARELVPFMPQLQQCRSRSDQAIYETASQLAEPASEGADADDVISQDEYRFLFQQSGE